MFTKDWHKHIELRAVLVSTAAELKTGQGQVRIEVIHIVGLRNDIADVHALERNP